MSRIPRSAMIRKAHSLPKGDAERREIIAAAGHTWGRQLETLKLDFLKEVVKKATDILKDEGIRATGSVPAADIGVVKGSLNGEPVAIYYSWDDRRRNTMKSTMTLGRNSRIHRNDAMSLSPANVASESIYKHFGGLLE